MRLRARGPLEPERVRLQLELPGLDAVLGLAPQNRVALHACMVSTTGAAAIGKAR